MTCEQSPKAPLPEDQETYFKRGARVKPVQRRALIEANMRPERPPQAAYDLAMSNLHKPWARRYLRAFRFVP
jgi:hypothetical protein